MEKNVKTPVVNRRRKKTRRFPEKQGAKKKKGEVQQWGRSTQKPQPGQQRFYQQSTRFQKKQKTAGEKTRFLIPKPTGKIPKKGKQKKKKARWVRGRENKTSGGKKGTELQKKCRKETGGGVRGVLVEKTTSFFWNWGGVRKRQGRWKHGGGI